MTSTIFRQIAAGGSRTAKAERLFRAAISAFCSLTRPSQMEIAQIDDLTLPLFDSVSQASRRFAAAALSECAHAPVGLLQRLCAESVEVCAPLLIRSPVLTDIQIIALISRHGIPHARAIERRLDLHPAIAALVRVLMRDAVQQEVQSRETAAPDAVGLVDQPAPDFTPILPRSLSREAGENARRRLRGMMGGGGGVSSFGARGIFGQLRETALHRHRPFFDTTLADALDLSVPIAQRVATDASGDLPLALHALGLKPEEAFLIVAAVQPAVAADVEAIKAFLDRFHSLTSAESDAAVQRWRSAAPPPVRVKLA